MDELTNAALRVVMGAFEGPRLPDWARRRLGDGLGSMALFGSNVVDVEQLSALTAEIHAAGDQVITCTDEEGGDVTRLHMSAGSPHPGNAALGAADDERLTERVAALIGAELVAAGVDLDLAPVVDVNSNPRNPVIGVRSFGADPELVARHTRAYVRGLQSAGVGACVKHFPGHGDTAVDSHLDLPMVDAPLELLRRRELVPFRAAVEADAVAVMTSHVLLPAIDPDRPATLSPAVLGLLRAAPGVGGLGYTGLVVSDAVDMKGASGGRGVPAAAVLALAAGCDLICLGADKDAELVDAVVGAVVAAVRATSGPAGLSRERLLDAAGRVTSTARLLDGWSGRRAGSASTGGAGSGTAAAADAATLAVRVVGVLPRLDDAVVLRFVTGTNVAVGQVPWGLPRGGLVLGVGEHRDVTEGARVDAILASAEGRPLVALVREQHRHAWVRELLAQLCGARPDTVVVEMGWPGPAPLPSAVAVHTFGAGRASAAALDAVLGAAVATGGR